MRELSLTEFASRVGKMLAEDGPDPVALGVLGIILKHSESYPDAPPLVRVLSEGGELFYQLDAQRARALGFI